MEIKGKVSILVSEDATRIQITDPKSSKLFVEVKLTPHQLSRCLSREAKVECTLNVQHLDKVGKRMEMLDFNCTIPKDIKNMDLGEARQLKIQAEVQKNLNLMGGGWIAGEYYGSKGTWGNESGDNIMVHTTVRRWVSE